MSVQQEPSPCIDGYRAELVTVLAGEKAFGLYAVGDLEARVDRNAVLRGDAEPPYWAYLWAGARALADYAVRFVPLAGRRVIEIGCGLGAPGLAAAHAGADVVLVDTALSALRFTAASAAVNGLHVGLACCDFRRLAPQARFDVILASEIVYDPDCFGDLVAVFARHLAPGGVALLADGHRRDARSLYTMLRDGGLTTHAIEHQVLEEGHVRPMRIAAVSLADAGRGLPQARPH